MTQSNLLAEIGDASAVRAIAELAEDATASEVLEPGGIYAFRLGDRVEVVDLTDDKYFDQPKHKSGNVIVTDVPSFLAYYAKHADADSEIYADQSTRLVTAILDAHTKDNGPRWCNHRLILKLTHSEQFRAWSQINGSALSQTQFAEFVEDHRADVRRPSAADLLEMAEHFQATTKVTFRSGTKLQSGQRTLQYVEQIDASAGTNGEMTVPTELVLGLPIFEGAKLADSMTARLRYRINTEGKLTLIVILDQVAEALTGAFESVISEITEGLLALPTTADAPVPFPILRGAAPAR